MEFYLAHVRALDRTEFAYPEDIEVLRVFKPAFGVPYIPIGKSAREAFNAFALDVWNTSKQTQVCDDFECCSIRSPHTPHVRQNKGRRVRHPEERWCHWQEGLLPIKTAYALPARSVESRRCGIVIILINLKFFRQNDRTMITFGSVLTSNTSKSHFVLHFGCYCTEKLLRTNRCILSLSYCTDLNARQSQHPLLTVPGNYKNGPSMITLVIMRIRTVDTSH